MSETKKVYEAISKVTTALIAHGIEKSRENKDQNFMFRGIDDVLKALAPLLSANKLCILPNVTSREVMARTTASGKTTYNVALKVEYAIVSAEDGSTHVVSAYGEANDTQDKSTGKAMSMAYKSMCFQAFCIATEGNEDADAGNGDSAWDSQVADYLTCIEDAADRDAAGAVYKAAIAKCKEKKDVTAANTIKAAMNKKWPVPEKAPA